VARQEMLRRHDRRHRQRNVLIVGEGDGFGIADGSHRLLSELQRSGGYLYRALRQACAAERERDDQQHRYPDGHVVVRSHCARPV